MREAAFEAMGTLLKVMGDRAMTSYLESVDKAKVTKVSKHMPSVNTLRYMVGMSLYNGYYKFYISTTNIVSFKYQSCSVFLSIQVLLLDGWILFV